MRVEGDQIYEDVDEARAGSTPNIARWVLTFSLLGAIVLLTIIWVTGAFSSDQNTNTAGARIEASQKAADGSTTDSIVSDHADQMNAATPGQSTDPQNVPNKNSNGK